MKASVLLVVLLCTVTSLNASECTKFIGEKSSPEDVRNAIKCIDKKENRLIDSLPLGSIIAWHKSFDSSQQLPYGWIESNGQLIRDKESPFNGLNVPDINKSNLFIRGGLTSGKVSEDTFKSHQHQVNVKHTTSESPDHSHKINERITTEVAGSHAHRYSQTSGAGNGTAANGPHSITLREVNTENSGNHTHIVKITADTNSTGKHSHQINIQETTDLSGETETAPKNIEMVWIIKIK